jgi:hypothetical protein
VNLTTKHMTQAEFDGLRISDSGAYDQPACRYQTSTGQWLYIAPGECAVIEVTESVASHDLASTTKAVVRRAINAPSSARRKLKLTMLPRKWRTAEALGSAGSGVFKDSNGRSYRKLESGQIVRAER